MDPQTLSAGATADHNAGLEVPQASGNSPQNTSLPPLPSQIPHNNNNNSKNKPQTQKEVTNASKTLPIGPNQNSVHKDNTIRLDNLTSYQVPKLEQRKVDEIVIDQDNENDEVRFSFNNKTDDKSFSDITQQPAIRKRVPFSQQNADNIRDNNTDEPSALYANAQDDDVEDDEMVHSSPNPSSSPTATANSTIVIDNGFVVKDHKINTSKQNGNKNTMVNRNNQTAPNTLQQQQQQQQNSDTFNRNNNNDNDYNNSQQRMPQNNNYTNNYNNNVNNTYNQQQKLQQQQRQQQQQQRADDEARKALDNLLENNEIPPVELQPPVLGLLKSELIQAMIGQDYDRAAEVESASNLLSTAYEWRASEIRKQEMQQTLSVRMDTLRKTYDSEILEWQKIFGAFEQQQKAQKDQLEAAHSEAFAVFEQKWSDSSTVLKFRKPSSSLLQMRKQQKSMAIARQFEDAKRMKMTADTLQFAETEMAKKKAEAAMITEYNMLVEKQNREMQVFYEHQQKTETFLRCEQRKIFQPLEMQMRQLKAALERDRPTNLKPNRFTFTSTTKSRAVRTEKLIPQASPRTVSAYTVFRQTEEAPRLAINGLNVRKIIGKNRAASAARTIRITRTQLD